MEGLEDESVVVVSVWLGLGLGVGLSVGEGDASFDSGEVVGVGAGEVTETVKIGPYHPAQNPLSIPETSIIV